MCLLRRVGHRVERWILEDVPVVLGLPGGCVVSPAVAAATVVATPAITTASAMVGTIVDLRAAVFGRAGVLDRAGVGLAVGLLRRAGIGLAASGIARCRRRTAPPAEGPRPGSGLSRPRRRR